MVNGNRELLNRVHSFVNDADLRLRPFVLSGELNKAYIQGMQYRRINDRILAIEGMKTHNSLYLERKVFNRMLPIYLTRYGILSQNQPITGFRGTDNREESVTNAVEGNKFLEAFRKDIHFDDKYQKAVQQADVFGLVWFKTGIDWSKGDEIEVRDITIKKPSDKDFKANAKRSIREGRVFIDVIPMHEILVDSLAVESMEDINEQNDYNETQSLNTYNKNKNQGPVKLLDQEESYINNPYYNNLSDYQKRKKVS